MYIVKSYRKRADGSKWTYYYLRDTVWDKKLKRQKNIYLAYLGTKRVITQAKARAICKKLGITLEELKKVKRLKIVKVS